MAASETERFRSLPRNRLGVLILACAALFALAGGCRSQVQVADTVAGTQPERVLVLPFQNLSGTVPAHANVRSPVTGKVFPTGPIMDGAEALLTEHMVTYLENRKEYIVLPPGYARGALSRMALDNDDLIPVRERILKIGGALGADHVVAGFVYRFRERSGTAYGVSQPASVAFDVHLIQVAGGLVRWSASLDETQVSLSEDLFQINKFIQHKGKWVTAPEMARTALDAALQRFP